MPNLLSVTQRGPDVFEPVRSAIDSPVGKETVGGIRKAGAILKGNPLSLLLSELIFPQPMADGTMHGKPAFRADPKVDQFLKTQKSQMDSGISGTFVPVR